MKFTIILFALLLSSGCVSQKDLLVYDSLLSVVKSKHKTVTQVDLRIRDKEYKVNQIKVDNLQFSMINLLETEDDQKKYNYMKGFFLRYNNQILLFRGDDFLESSSTFNNVYQVVVMDTDYVVNYAIHFSDNQLIGVSKFKYVDSENLELFCLILTDLDNTLLSQINILKLTDQDWLDKMFESKSTSDPNLIYIKSHTKSELFYRFVENSPDRL